MLRAASNLQQPANALAPLPVCPICSAPVAQVGQKKGTEEQRKVPLSQWDMRHTWLQGKDPFQAALMLSVLVPFWIVALTVKMKGKKICPVETNLWGLHFIYGKIIQQGQWGIGLQGAPAPLMSNLLINSFGNAAKMLPEWLQHSSRPHSAPEQTFPIASRAGWPLTAPSSLFCSPKDIRSCFCPQI